MIVAVVLMAKFDALKFLELAQRHRATHAMLVPVQYQRILAHPDFDIERGTSDGVDLGGTRAVLLGDFPADPSAGNGLGRVYVDERASAEQRRELEAIFTGQRGGNWEAFSGLFASFLPAETARPQNRSAGPRASRLRLLSS